MPTDLDISADQRKVTTDDGFKYSVASAKRTDDRRNRDYRLDLRVIVTVPAGRTLYRGRPSFDAREDGGPLPPTVMIKDWVEVLRSGGDYARESHYKRDAMFHSAVVNDKLVLIRLVDTHTETAYWGDNQDYTVFRFEIPANRPSEIPTYEEALEALDKIVTGEKFQGHTAMDEFLIAGLRNTLDELDRAEAIHHEQEQAGRVAETVAASAIREAKAVCRFEQRLAALVAELSAEYDVQLKTKVAQIPEMIRKHNEESDEDDQITERAGKAAAKHIERFKHSTNPRSFLGRSVSTPKVSYKEIREIGEE